MILDAAQFFTQKLSLICDENNWQLDHENTRTQTNAGGAFLQELFAVTGQKDKSINLDFLEETKGFYKILINEPTSTSRVLSYKKANFIQNAFKEVGSVQLDNGKLHIYNIEIGQVSSTEAWYTLPIRFFFKYYGNVV